MAPDRPQALLIDFGGVLTHPIAPVFAGYCERHGLPGDALALVMADDGPLAIERDAYERGESDDATFLPLLAARLGLAAVDPADLVADLVVDDAMFAAVERLRALGVRTCLLSNSWGTDAYPRDRLARAFDEIVISGEVGLRKPDDAIYHHAAAVIGVPARRCVFVDDAAVNVAAAHRVGMTGLLHTAPEATIAALEDLFTPASSPRRPRRSADR